MIKQPLFQKQRLFIFILANCIIIMYNKNMIKTERGGSLRKKSE